eukprot:scaffold106_cov109-Isochrysis_galbana.AAC.7
MGTAEVEVASSPAAWQSAEALWGGTSIEPGATAPHASSGPDSACPSSESRILGAARRAQPLAARAPTVAAGNCTAAISGGQRRSMRPILPLPGSWRRQTSRPPPPFMMHRVAARADDSQCRHDSWIAPGPSSGAESSSSGLE